MSVRTVWFVTDPLCSWCWGMANAVAQVREELAGRVQFDMLLGGINVQAVTPLTDALLPRFQGIWARVAQVTGQDFCMRFPPGGTFVYNSMPICLAIAAVRELVGRPPFAFLHALQAAFFLHARDTSDIDELTALAVATEGVAPAEFRRACAAAGLPGRLAGEMQRARSFGTAALPAVLVEADDGCRLLAGGYADAPMLRQMIEDWLARQPGSAS